MDFPASGRLYSNAPGNPEGNIVRASKITRDKAALRQNKETDLKSLRSYCLVCNRYYFAKSGLQVEALQLHQHHDGICQERNYSCARIFASPAWSETKQPNEAAANSQPIDGTASNPKPLDGAAVDRPGVSYHWLWEILLHDGFSEK